MTDTDNSTKSAADRKGKSPAHPLSRLRSPVAWLMAVALAGSAVGIHSLGAEIAPMQRGAAPSPKSATQVTEMPNFVDLVQAVKSAVVSVRVKGEALPQVLSDDGDLRPFEGTPFKRFFRGFPWPDQERRFGQKPRRPFFTQSQGSGFLISADGYIVTNNHVVAKASNVEVAMHDATTLDARLVGSDPKTDLALLKVEGRTDLPFVRFADVDPKIGEWVVAMGNPFGLGGTVTAGIVSAHDRDIGSGPYDDFLQIDAAVNRGNSGGPTFNMNGRVVGVNTAIYSPTGTSIGIAFAIPAPTAEWVVEQLKEHGYVERGWLGVRIQPVTKAIAESLGLERSSGALIAEAQPESPAQRAGIESGDVITSVNGNDVKDPRDLAGKIASVKPNTKVTIGYVRSGKRDTVEVTIGQLKETKRRPPDAEHDDQPTQLGLTVAPAARVEGAGRKGLAVLGVEPNSKAAELGFATGDVILKAGGTELDQVADLTSAIDAARSKGKRNVLVLVERDENRRYVAVPVPAG